MSHTEITKDEQVLNAFIQSKARLVRAKREIRLHINKDSDVNLTLNDITYAVLQLITEINENL